VLEKIGFAHEGCRREFIAARGRDEILELHGMLRWEWAARTEFRKRESDLARAA
jgi:RimJ/RimL family protein N-acetyltransferase